MDELREAILNRLHTLVDGQYRFESEDDSIESLGKAIKIVEEEFAKLIKK